MVLLTRCLQTCILTMLIVWTTGCARQSHLKAKPIELVSLSSPSIKASPEYRLGPGDMISIKFFNNPEFDDTVPVRPDGRISLAKVGELDVSQLTPAQLDSIITAEYENFVIDPDITVIVREFGLSKVYVLGEVKAPGGFELERDVTLIQAIAAAGGPTISAKLDHVMILRGNRSKGVQALKINLLNPLNASSADVIIDNNLNMNHHDIVYLPKTFVGSASDFLGQVYKGLLPPIDSYLRALFWINR